MYALRQLRSQCAFRMNFTTPVSLSLTHTLNFIIERNSMVHAVCCSDSCELNQSVIEAYKINSIKANRFAYIIRIERYIRHIERNGTPSFLFCTFSRKKNRGARREIEIWKKNYIISNSILKYCE